MTAEPPDRAPSRDPAPRHVSVEGVRLRFAAAHMATIGAELEPLHGHNYELRCRVEGALAADGWVIDFAALKRLAREVCAELDHRFLLQARSTLLASELRDGAWRLRCGDRGYVFPAADVVALPIANSTAELLAEWCWERLAAALAAEGQRGLARLAVEVEEMPGQAGGYARDLPA